MALYAFDGTWNEDEADALDDTNVVKFHNAYNERKEYIKGVGTRFGAVGRLLGGVFGAGGKSRIEEMYDLLVENWQAHGDQTIDIIGFSRGAALALHFANVIDKAGIVAGGEVVARPQIRFLGLWDVVASFGIPINIGIRFQELNLGFDLQPPGNVACCYHAMALHERRQTFAVTRLDKGDLKPNVEEIWFRGVHSDVGGGNKNPRLNRIALAWMLSKARDHGLPIDAASVPDIGPDDHKAPIGENFDPITNPKRRTLPSDRFHETARGRRLAVGEREDFVVDAKELYSWSGIRMEAGAHYAFVIPEGQIWEDGGMECGPAGWQTEELNWLKEAVVENFEGRRRCPKANWFELIGAAGNDEDELFRIGAGGEEATYLALDDDELFAFANDLRSFYGNNEGSMKVTVIRMPGAGARQLKSCAEA